MLLLTLLSLSGWAQGVITPEVIKVGDYDVEVNTRFVQAGNQLAISSVKKATESVSFEPGAIIGTDGKTVPELNQVGSYFQQVTVTEGTGDNITTKSIYVPFMVVKSGSDYFNKEYIWNSATWDASVNDGILKYYFSRFPWYDLYKAGNPEFAGNLTEGVWNALSDEQKAAYTHDWKAIAKSTVYRDLMFPQINFFVKGLERDNDPSHYAEWEKYAVYATYKVRTNPGVTPAEYVTKETYTQLDEGKPALLPRGGYWMISIPELYKDRYPLESTGDIVDGLAVGEGYVLKYADNGEPMKKGNPDWTAFTADELADDANISNALQGDFDWDYVNLYLAPQVAPFKMVATVTNPTLAYTNSVKDPGLVVYVGETQISPKGDQADGYEVKWYQDGEEAQLIEAGTYIGIVTYKENVAIVEFTITRAEAEIVLNPAYVEKVYGNADPAPKFKQEGGEFYGNDDIESEIMPFLVLKRSDEDPVATREDVGDHLYYIDFTDDYRAGKCNYEITILQNHSILTIIPRPLSIQVTEATATKEYNTADPTFLYLNDEGMKGQLQFNDAEKASGTPGADDIITSITREKAGTAEGEAVTEAGNEYVFTATSKNYKVTVTNGFAITPSTDVAGLQFAFENGGSYTYTGLAQTPTFTIKDTHRTPAYELQPNVDYVEEVTYANNVDVTTEATATVTLKGNYTGTAVGKFAITKASLTVAAKSYTADPGAGNYEYGITGWVNNETAATQEARNTTDPVVTYFKAPDASTVVTKNNTPLEGGVYALEVSTAGFEAKNYSFKAQNGLLALNGTEVITVKATSYKKEYDGIDVTSEDLKDNIAVFDKNNDPILGFDKSKLVLPASGPIYEIAKAATGHKHNSTAEATGANEGFYNITLRGARVTKDYTINWQGLEDGCEIDYRAITLKADDKTKVFGAAVPTLTAQVVAGKEVDGKVVGGLIDPDTEESIGLVNGSNGYYVTLSNPYRWRNNTWQINGEHATTEGNEYPISIGFFGNNIFGNYRVATENAKLTVTKASVTIAAKDDTKQFGTADPEFTITVTPANDGTPASVATVANMDGFWTIARTDKDAADGEKVGDHKTLKVTLTDAGKNAQDYVITAATEDGTLTITAAQMYVWAQGQWINYGGKINEYDVIIKIPANNQDGYKILTWNKRGVDASDNPIELDDDKQAENDAIMALGHLEVLEGKDKIGTNYDAYKFVVTDANYAIAPDEVVDGETVLGFNNNTLLVYPLEVIPLGAADLAEITTKKLKQVLQDHQGCTVTVVLPTDHVPMRANEWYSFVLPFDVRVRNLSNALGWCAPNVLDTEKSAGSNIHFKLETGTIPANTPFIVKVDQPIASSKASTFNKDVPEAEKISFEDPIQFEGVTIAPFEYATKNPGADETADVQFIGVYEPTRIYASNEWFLNFKSDEPNKPRMFYYANATKGSPIYETEAYAVAPREAGANVRFYIQEADGTITTIDGVETVADEAEFAEGWYTITGVKLTAEPTVSGTYIYNGKKVFFQAK